MSLNPAMIYRRTDRGVREVYEKSHQFTQSERLILILLDGRLNVAGLQARLPSLNDERIERALGKLQEANLVEPMGSMDAIKASGLVPEIARLEPEAVAHFLEQTDLDPVTVFGSTDEEVATELVRASVEHAAAQLAREASGDVRTARPPSIRSRARNGESVHSHPRRAAPPVPDTEPEWDPTEATRFAITTVNVPDRLDLQEERDRADAEDYAEERRRISLQLWMKRLLVVAVVAVFGAVLYGMLKPLRDDTSAERLAQRLSGAFGLPVQVDETSFQLSPTPRLVLSGVDVGGQFRVDEVALLINWVDLWAALRGGQWVWGEATVAPMTLTAAQALSVVKTVPTGAQQLPGKISTLRFQSLRVADSRLFPGRYEAVLRRGSDGQFGPLAIRQLDADGGAMELMFRPATVEAEAGAGAVDFTLQAERWLLPVGPTTRWNTVRAQGRIDGHVLEVSDFALAGYFGVTSGTVYAATDVEWVVTGAFGASNIDLESVMTALRPRGQGAPDGALPPMQGTADFRLVVTGRGASLDDAVARSTVSGPFQVRFATLNGINLGLAATQGAMAAGTTRFTEFDGMLAASANGVRFEDTGGRAGAMAARGDFTVAPDLELAGGVRVELGGQTVQAPVNLRIRGSALDPRFGR